MWGGPGAPGEPDRSAACDFIDVVGERERHYIGRRAIDEGTRLAAGPAMRLPHLNRFSDCLRILLSELA